MDSTINEAVQATLDSNATPSTQPSNWEAGLSSVIAAYAAPRLEYHVLCSDPSEADVSSFATADAMLQHLCTRYHQPYERKEGESTDVELEAKCIRMMRQNDQQVTEQQEDEEDGEASSEFPFDEEIAALHGERLTLQRRTLGEPWSASASPALSPSLAPLLPPYVLFQQCNLRWKGMHRDSWMVEFVDSDEELVSFLRDHPAGREDNEATEDEEREGEQMGLNDLLRRALHHSEQDTEHLRTAAQFLVGIFHRARKVWYVKDNENTS